MTKQEHFKKRVRVRMATTGERYAAARKALLDQAASRSGRTWAAEPEMSDDAIRAGTGKGWDEWCDIIDAWPGHTEGRTAVAKWIEAETDLTGWWAQGVTGGWERITGRRLPYQRADGTFTAGKSKTVSLDASSLRDTLLDADGRSDLFPGVETTLRSKPTAQNVRLGIATGVALIGVEDTGDGRAKVTVAHEKLATYDEVAAWKFWWGEWLEALDG